MVELWVLKALRKKKKKKKVTVVPFFVDGILGLLLMGKEAEGAFATKRMALSCF